MESSEPLGPLPFAYPFSASVLAPGLRPPCLRGDTCTKDNTITIEDRAREREIEMRWGVTLGIIFREGNVSHS